MGILEMLGHKTPDYLSNNRMKLAQFGLGMMGQDGIGGAVKGGLAGGIQGSQFDQQRLAQQQEEKQRLDAVQQASQQKNATLEYLRRQGRDDLLSAIEGGMPVADAWQEVLKPQTTPDRKTIKGADGYNYFLDSGDRVLPDVVAAQKSPLVEINQGEGSKFYDELDKKNAGLFFQLSDTGLQANQKLAQIDRLEGLLSQAPSGGQAVFKQALGEFGIPTEGLSEIQAAQALINKLVPEQRQPGSGPMSDADLLLFKQSLPRIVNQPGGNELIIQTMRGIAQYEAQQGQIADMVANRDITAEEGRKMLRDLKNPLDEFKKVAGTTKPTNLPDSIDELYEFFTPEERALFEGG
ncbi:hypothetical protein JY97_00705 [Alkalispirochaeta odontotermitis]|nr:hypothetical protein JY97_00705 [Alkalispirochaeta odontotermitis]